MKKNTTIIFLFFLSLLFSCTQNQKPIVEKSKEEIENINFVPKKTDKVVKGDISLKTQKEIEEFGKNNYTFIDGNLVIGNADGGAFSEEIFNIDALKSIKTINGELYIIMINTLQTVEGLTNLERVNGDFTISGCGYSLKKISGFNKLTTINGQVVFGNNVGQYRREDGLIDISGFNEVNYVESIFISGNSGLKTLDCFNKIETIKTIQIMNSSIEEIANFKNLKIVNKNFSVEYSELLTKVFLPKLEIVKGFFALNDNGKINGNVQLPKLKKINSLYLNSNRSFENYCDFSDAIKQNKINTLITEVNKKNLTKKEIIEHCK